MLAACGWSATACVGDALDALNLALLRSPAGQFESGSACAACSGAQKFTSSFNSQTTCSTCWDAHAIAAGAATYCTCNVGTFTKATIGAQVNCTGLCQYARLLLKRFPSQFALARVSQQRQALGRAHTATMPMRLAIPVSRFALVDHSQLLSRSWLADAVCLQRGNSNSPPAYGCSDRLRFRDTLEP